MQFYNDPFCMLEPEASRQREEVKLLITHFNTMGLVGRPSRRLTVSKGAASVSIIPVVNVTKLDTPFHRHEGAISLTNEGGVVGCIATIDTRTTIASVQFFHVNQGKVLEGPKFSPADIKVAPTIATPPPEEAPIDPGALAVFVLRVLSTDLEARFVHPNLDYAELFSDQNQQFLAGVSREMFAQMRGGGISLLSISTSTSTSCTGCTSCSTSSAASMSINADESQRWHTYLSMVTPEQRWLAQSLVKNLRTECQTAGELS